MPWTLYRYILKDLLKLMALSGGALLAVISVAVAIKPLADGLLEASAVPRFVFYLMPTMLPLVLPFAGAFASVMVFSRLTTDNEILACSAGGISYWRILMPIYLLGAVLMVTLFGLSNWVVPQFFRKAELMIQEDITRVVVTKLKSDQTFTFDKFSLWADQAEQLTPTKEFLAKIRSEVPPYAVIAAKGVVVGETDRDGKPVHEFTAESATMLLFRDRGQTAASLRLSNAFGYNAVSDEARDDDKKHNPWQGRVGDVSFPPVRLPSRFQDDPAFLSREELQELSRKPLEYDRVRVHWEKLCQAMAAEVMKQLSYETIRDPDGDWLRLLGAVPDETYTIRAPQVEVRPNGLLLTSAGNRRVGIDRRLNGTLSRHYSAKSAWVRFEPGAPAPEPRAVIELTEAVVEDIRIAGAPPRHAELTLDPMRWPEPMLDKQRVKPLNDILDEAGKSFLHVPEIAKRHRIVIEQRAKLWRRIVSQTHERAALAIISMLALFVSAVLAMSLRETMSLQVFLIAFALTFLAIIVTHSGENLLIEPDNAMPVGIAATWAGVVILMVALFVTYRKLADH